MYNNVQGNTRFLVDGIRFRCRNIEGSVIACANSKGTRKVLVAFRSN